MKGIVAFARFCYDFLVGDDWRLVVVVLAGLVLTYGLSRSGVPAWWALPAVVVVALPLSVLRATRGR